ncbi:MAG TPA: hypothetical protein VMF89_32710 [Polyangiales bacterium]|nr:hypothetical protein [Polyangiales bacterium]
MIVGVYCLYACGSEAEMFARPSTSAPAAAAASDTAAAGTAAPAVPVLPRAGDQAPLVPVSTPAQTMGCKAGHYIGKFVGDYRSAAWYEGGEIIMFATADFDGKPGFEFWLESVEQPCMPGQEFCPGAVVKGGKLRGNVTPFEDANDPNTMGGLGFSVRFEIDLTGELDCNTGMFRGRLENGCYDILSVLHRFDGTITGDYVLATSAFTAGAWNVEEELMAGAMPTNMLGGAGEWSAEHVDDSAAPTGPGAGLCSGQSGFDTPP